jgi:hypothetical protein
LEVADEVKLIGYIIFALLKMANALNFFVVKN